MSGPEVLVPLTMFAGGFAMVFGIVYLRTKENLAMVEKGMNPKERRSRPAPFWSLKLGLLMLGAGIGVLTAYIIDINISKSIYEHHPPLYFGFIAVGGGLGLIVSYMIEKKYLYQSES